MKPFGLATCLLLLFVLVFGMPMGCCIDPPEDVFEFSSEELSQFTDFFTMTAPATNGAVESYNPAGREPSSVYVGDRSTSYYSYQSSYMGTNSLWIMGVIELGPAGGLSPRSISIDPRLFLQRRKGRLLQGLPRQ